MVTGDLDVFHDPITCHDLAFEKNSSEYAYSKFI